MQYLYSAASELSTNAAPRSSKRHATGSEGGPVMGTHRIENWPSAAATMAPELQKEFAAHAGDGRVGNKLLSETDRVRVWAIGLKPGQRLGFHTHVLDAGQTCRSHKSLSFVFSSN